MRQHKPKIRTLWMDYKDIAGQQTRYYRGTCTCGWRGPMRANPLITVAMRRHNAIQDAHAHAREAAKEKQRAA